MKTLLLIAIVLLFISNWKIALMIIGGAIIVDIACIYWLKCEDQKDVLHD